MSRGNPRTVTLNPLPVISTIENYFNEGKLTEEVYIRRALSALFLALFNYWSAKKYESGSRGKGHYQDRWTYTEFVNDMLSKGLDPQIIHLVKFRVAADHYTLNPTFVEVHPIQYRESCEITGNNLKRAIECAKELYNILSQN